MSQSTSISPRNVNSYFAVQSPENQIDKKNLDKSQPYRSCVEPEVRGFNGEVKPLELSKSKEWNIKDGAYVCRHIATKVVLDSSSNTNEKGKVNLENYNTAEQLQAHLKDITDNDFYKIMVQPTDLDLIDNVGLGNYLVKQFKTMNLDTTKTLPLITENHAMALRLRCKGSEDAKEYVVQLFDPNTTNSSVRVKKCDLSSIGSLELKQFMPEFQYKGYFPKAGTDVGGDLYVIHDDKIRDKKYIQNNSQLKTVELPRFCLSRKIAPDIKFSVSDIKEIARMKCEITRSAALSAMVMFNDTDLFKVYMGEVAGLNLPDTEQVKRLQAYADIYNEKGKAVRHQIPSNRFNDYLQAILDSDHFSKNVKRAFVLNLTEQGEPRFLTGLRKDARLMSIIGNLREDLFSKSEKQAFKENIIFGGKLNGAAGLIELINKENNYRELSFYLSVFDDLKTEHKYKLLQEKNLDNQTIVDAINVKIRSNKEKLEKHFTIVSSIINGKKNIPTYQRLINKADQWDDETLYSRMPTLLKMKFNIKKYVEFLIFKRELNKANDSFLVDKEFFLGSGDISQLLESKGNKKTSRKNPKNLDILKADSRNVLDKMKEKADQKYKEYEPVKCIIAENKSSSEYMNILREVINEEIHGIFKSYKKYEKMKNNITCQSLNKMDLGSLYDDWEAIDVLIHTLNESLY